MLELLRAYELGEREKTLALEAPVEDFGSAGPDGAHRRSLGGLDELRIEGRTASSSSTTRPCISRT